MQEGWTIGPLLPPVREARTTVLACFEDVYDYLAMMNEKPVKSVILEGFKTCIGVTTRGRWVINTRQCGLREVVQGELNQFFGGRRMRYIDDQEKDETVAEFLVKEKKMINVIKL
jgi:hypothetical protein